MRFKIKSGPLAFILIASVLFLALLCGYRMATQPLAVTKGRLFFAELGAEVRVRRDGYGVPHVFARNEDDLFFAQGFITAQDRLWQMDCLRRTVQGRLSEWFGAQASGTDSLMRRYAMGETAKRQWRTLDESSRRILERYASGVNAFIRHYHGRFSFEYRLMNRVPDLWKPEDSISLLQAAAWRRDERWLSDPFFAELGFKIDPKRFRELFPNVAFHDTAYLGGESRAAAWNAFLRRVLAEKWIPPPVSGNLAWAVSSARSASGKPLLSIVLRSAFTNPSPWYEMRLSAGAFHVQGFTLPGIPMVLAGHNKSAAWGNTALLDGLLPAEGLERKEGIPAVWNSDRELHTLNRLNTDLHWNAFADARFTYDGCGGVFVCADTAGKIGSRRYGPFAQTLYRTNFQEGWTGVDESLARGTGLRLPPQSGRLRRLMAEKKKVALENFKQIQSDLVSENAATWTRMVRTILRGDSLKDAIQNRLLESLFRWDGSMRHGSAEAAWFETFVLEFADLLCRDEMGDSLFASFLNLSSFFPECLGNILKDPLSPWFDDVRTKDRIETAAEILKQSLVKSAEKLKIQWGDDFSKWSWAGLHTLSFRHPLEQTALVGWMFRSGPFATGGSYGTIASADVDWTSPFRTSAGASAKMVLDLSNWDNSVSVLPPGQSGQLLDPHLQDQVQLYLENYYRPMLWDSSKVEQAGWDLLLLQPESAHAAL